jgi:hypothetical protein
VVFVKFHKIKQYTEVHFASFLSGGFTTMTVMNPPERRLAKRTSVCNTSIESIDMQLLAVLYKYNFL